MLLTVSCKNCKSKNKLKRTASDRVELAKKYGKVFDLTCSKCLKENTYHINKVRASKSRLGLLITILSIILEVLVLYALLDIVKFQNAQAIFIYPVALTIIPLIFFVWLTNEQKAIHNFNKFRL